MRVAVIGTTGFIGSNFVSRLGSTRKDLHLRTITRGADKLKKKTGYLNMEVVEAF